ncbi:MAG: hypothetical protein J1D77_01775 [Muribaculaceae bacterium]|nr:hypothetical protein [Muribaculaceae bacterium]
MKKLFSKILFFFAIAIGITSCGGGSSASSDPNLNAQEREVVVKTEKSLPKGDKLENYKIVTSSLPLALLDDEYKSTRDQVFKARLDYINCIKRGLDSHAQKNLETLQEIQKQIGEKEENLKSTSPNYIFVLAEVKERTRRDGKLSGFIAIYDPENLEQVDLVQVTTPLYKNAEMMTEALDGTLADPATFSKDPSELTSSNPVVEFILRSNPK